MLCIDVWQALLNFSSRELLVTLLMFLAFLVIRSLCLISNRIPRYPHIDPLFGIDLFMLTLRNLKNHKHISSIAARHSKYGHTYSSLALGENVINTINPENIKAVYGTSVSTSPWGVEPMRLIPMEPICGSGFITRDGEAWMEFRAMLKPGFVKERIEDFESSGFAGLVESWIQGLPEGQTLDLMGGLYELFLDSAGLWLLGTTFQDSQSAHAEDKGEGEERRLEMTKSSETLVRPQIFLKELHKAERWMGLRMIFGSLGRLVSNLNKQWFECIRTIHSFVDQQVAVTLYRNSSSDLTLPRHRYTPLVAHLATVSPAHVRSQTIQALMATQDTTSTLVSNAIFLLARTPSLWATLRAEALTIGFPISASALRKSRLITNILNETLRLYPPFAMLYRHALRDTKLPCGGGKDGQSPVEVTKGTRVATCTFALHRDEHVFGPAIETFNPMRWNHIHPRPGEYLPFGYGPRACCGQDRARLEAGYLLVRMAAVFENCESRDDEDFLEETKLNIRNKNGCWVRLLGRWRT